MTALLVAPVLVPAVAWGHSGTSAPGFIEVSRTIDGADTYMFSIRSDVSFNIVNTSFFVVEGFFPGGGGGNGTGAPVQDVGALVGVVRFKSETFCPTKADGGPCFVDMIGSSIKDATDVTVESTGPVSYSFTNDPNGFGHASLEVGITWSGVRGFHKAAPGDDFVTYRFFISIPGAESIRVKTHIHSNVAGLSVRDEAWHDGGFLFTGSDFGPSAHVDTMPAQALYQGVVDVAMDAGDPAPAQNHMYAMIGPSWFGHHTAFGSASATLNTAAVSFTAIERPDGRTTAGAGIGVGGTGGPQVVGATMTGTYRFYADAHVGVGAQDVYAIGFTGPIAG